MKITENVIETRRIELSADELAIVNATAKILSILADNSFDFKGIDIEDVIQCLDNVSNKANTDIIGTEIDTGFMSAENEKVFFITED